MCTSTSHVSGKLALPTQFPFLLFLCFILILSSPILVFGKSAKKSKTQRVPGTQRPYIIKSKRYYPIPTADGFTQKGVASWYGPNFHGRNTSNGEVYNMYEFTAAHKVLPMHTILLVKNLENGKETVVRVNDRGPFIYGRIIDLSYSAAKKLGVVNNGTAKVQIIAMGEGRKTANGEHIINVKDFNHGEFYVQIGAFVDKQNAIRLQRRFTSAGHTTVIQRYYTSESIFYRVQVYVGKELTKARKAEKTLHRHGYKGAFVIAR